MSYGTAGLVSYSYLFYYHNYNVFKEGGCPQLCPHPAEIGAMPLGELDGRKRGYIGQETGGGGL